MNRMHTPGSWVQTRHDAGLFWLASVAEGLCPQEQINDTLLEGLKFYRLDSPDEPQRCFYEPCVAIILRGRKRILFDGEEMTFGPGDFFATSIDIPTSAHVIEASRAAPYLSLIVRLDLAILHDISGKIEDHSSADGHQARGLVTGTATDGLVDAFSRLADLAARPADISLLGDTVKYELYVRLMQSEAGSWLRRMVNEGYRATGIVRSIDWLKRHYNQPLTIGDLARMAGMATSTFHHNFRHLTGTSPLQYQKTLRLYAARNLMLTERLDANTAAVRVGYESIPQFSREYSRLFGAPPRRDVISRRR